MTTISTNPVASLAALLQQADELHDGLKRLTPEQKAAWLLARGVQYDPSGAKAVDWQASVAAPPREPPPRSELTTAIVAAALDDVLETTSWEGKGKSLAPVLRAALEAQLARGRPEGPSAPPPNFEELIAAARFALKECEEITSCYPNAGDFWGLADNAAQELRRALAGEAVSAFAKAVCAPPGVDVERLNRAVDTMMEQAKNLRDVLRVRGGVENPR